MCFEVGKNMLTSLHCLIPNLHYLSSHLYAGKWSAALIILFSAPLCCTTICRAQSPYISRVYEYRPAPGQFVNVLPEYEEDDTERDMILKAEECIADHAGVVISLGGWGGYVTFGFDHVLVNVPGEYDLKILGNSFISDSPKDTSAIGGSAEPGIVMVSYDANANGIPDDEWYELAGSEHNNPQTDHQYSLTYFRTPDDHKPTPDKSTYKYLVDTTYIRWESSTGENGYMPKNKFHTQNYFPMWIEEDELTFSGTRLRDNGIDDSGTGSNYVLYLFDWGYADNHPNESSEQIPHAGEFNLDWAVDSNGESVRLPGVHFVRVYTGVHQQNGWLGECSTEVMDAYDLHPEAEPMGIDYTSAYQIAKPHKRILNGQLFILRDGFRYDVFGNRR